MPACVDLFCDTHNIADPSRFSTRYRSIWFRLSLFSIPTFYKTPFALPPERVSGAAVSCSSFSWALFPPNLLFSLWVVHVVVDLLYCSNLNVCLKILRPPATLWPLASSCTPPALPTQIDESHCASSKVYRPACDAWSNCTQVSSLLLSSTLLVCRMYSVLSRSCSSTFDRLELCVWTKHLVLSLSMDVVASSSSDEVASSS